MLSICANVEQVCIRSNGENQRERKKQKPKTIENETTVDPANVSPAVAIAIGIARHARRVSNSRLATMSGAGAWHTCIWASRKLDRSRVWRKPR